ncbi:MAG: capsid protein [Alphaproteobacteria bacterium 64-11]|nr:MAG: capsid protein [Alphaproteobacteria bacterium 64-11]
MSTHLKARARGLVGVRADSTDPTKILTELQRTFEAFKAENEEKLKEVKAGFNDVVKTEKVERINADITKLQSALDDVNAALAAARVGGQNGTESDPDKIEHAKAFRTWFRKGREENALRELEVKAAVTSSSDPDGGYVVPEQEESAIDRVLMTVSSMRNIAQVMPISTNLYKKLVGQGGAGYGWVGEKAARPETATPTLRELVFETMEVYANPAATQNTLDDARINIADWLSSEVGIIFAEQEGAAFVTGDGVNKPRGILGYDTVADDSYAWGKIGYKVSGVAAALSDGSHNGADAMIDLIYALKQGYRQNAGFIMNRFTQGTVRKLKDSYGQYLWQPSLQAGQPATFASYPITDDDNMPDIGANAFPIAFGDFKRGYLIIDRQGVRVLRDPYTNKPYVHFYTTKRVGGGVQNFEAFKLLKIST